jgi:hypothetical protein
VTSSDDGPRFPTDCALCCYLRRDGVFDVYACPSSLLTGLVWRWGVGAAYTTMQEQVDAMRATLSAFGVGAPPEKWYRAGRGAAWGGCPEADALQIAAQAEGVYAVAFMSGYNDGLSERAEHQN